MPSFIKLRMCRHANTATALKRDSYKITQLIDSFCYRSLNMALRALRECADRYCRQTKSDHDDQNLTTSQ